MTDIPDSLLRAIAGEPQPCEHIESLVEFMAKQPVAIIGGWGTRDTQIECQECKVTMAFHTFTGLVMGAMQNRN